MEADELTISINAAANAASITKDFNDEKRDALGLPYAGYSREKMVARAMNTRRGLHTVCRAASMSIIGSCLFVFACRGVETKWSARAGFPDGQWVSIARTQQYGGPGTAADITTVYLQRIGVSESPVEILAFSHQQARMNLEMRWLTPTHLEVAYGPSAKPWDHVSLDFQVVKIAGIDISVRNLGDSGVEE
jgi:hypothetical protein